MVTRALPLIKSHRALTQKVTPEQIASLKAGHTRLTPVSDSQWVEAKVKSEHPVIQMVREPDVVVAGLPEGIRVETMPATPETMRRTVGSSKPVVSVGGADALIAGLKASEPHKGYWDTTRTQYLPVELDAAQIATQSADLPGALRTMVSQLTALGADVPAPRAYEGLLEYLHRPGLEIWSKENFLVRPVLVVRGLEQQLTEPKLSAPFMKLLDVAHVAIERVGESETPDTATVVLALDGPLSEQGKTLMTEAIRPREFVRFE